ncbi:MAG: hypothetical protein ABFS32_02645 [Bacteroidota bacterium]
MKRIFSIVIWLNIDTAIGASITSMFIAQYLEVNIQLPALVALIITILLIYNFDHLIDANRSGEKSLNDRNRFYKDNKNALIGYEIILLVLLLAVSWYIPFEILLRGAILALFTALYFLLLFILLPQQFVFKELITAIVFMLGLFLIPVMELSEIINNRFLLLVVQIFLLALVNTFVISWYEYESDKQDAQPSIAIVVGKKAVYILSILGLILYLVTLFYSFIIGIYWIHIITLELMGSILFLSLVLNRYLVKNQAYRMVVDSIFIIPVISLIIAA